MLAPRQQINSAPYSVRSLSANTATTATYSQQLGGVAAGNYAQTNDPRFTDSRNPLSGSANYIQNQNSSGQSANFNIFGTGTAHIFNAATQYNIGGSRVLVTGIGGDGNLFVGASAGPGNPSGGFNIFVGSAAGRVTATGGSNSFFGNSAGLNNTTGGNTFVGSLAGSDNISGGNNTIVGSNADVFLSNLTNATAIGANAVVSQSNSLVLGNNASVGIGTSSPKSKLEIAGDVYLNNAANGVILKSPNGQCWRGTVGNTGTLTSAAITCP